MSKQAATIDDLYRYRCEGRAELIRGTIVELPFHGGLAGYATSEIVFALAQYEKQTKSGRAFASKLAYVVDLPQRQSFSPAASYHSVRKLSAKFVQGAPIFAVEVRSEDDYGPEAEKSLADKRADYFEAGTLVVWDVDVLHGYTIRSFRFDSPETPALFTQDQIATAEPALPGFEFPVANLIPDED
jgi:Uma2 family endonuclease